MRLSFWLWGGPPDADLRAAAAAGELDEAEGIRRQGTRMVEDAVRAPRGVEAFVLDWLGLHGLEGLVRRDLSGSEAMDLRDSAVATWRDAVDALLDGPGLGTVSSRDPQGQGGLVGDRERPSRTTHQRKAPMEK